MPHSGSLNNIILHDERRQMNAHLSSRRAPQNHFDEQQTCLYIAYVNALQYSQCITAKFNCHCRHEIQLFINSIACR